MGRAFSQRSDPVRGHVRPGGTAGSVTMPRSFRTAVTRSPVVQLDERVFASVTREIVMRGRAVDHRDRCGAGIIGGAPEAVAGGPRRPIGCGRGPEPSD